MENRGEKNHQVYCCAPVTPQPDHQLRYRMKLCHQAEPTGQVKGWYSSICLLPCTHSMRNIIFPAAGDSITRNIPA